MKKIFIIALIFFICSHITSYKINASVSRTEAMDTVYVSLLSGNIIQVANTTDSLAATEPIIVNYDSQNGIACDSVAALFNGGNGSSGSPLRIYTQKQLLTAMQIDQNYIDSCCFLLEQSLDFSALSNDIDLEKDPETGYAILPGFTKFNGVFNGSYNTISNFTLSSVFKSEISSGFFATIEDATVKNLTLENVTTTLTEDDMNERGSVMYMGALAGTLTNSNLSNCTIKNAKLTSTSIKPNDIAILAGYAENSTISDCSVTGVEMNITPTELLTYVERGIGMLVGEMNNSSLYGDKTIIKAEGSITVNFEGQTTRSSPNIGGAVGMLTGKSYIKNVIVGSTDSYSNINFTYTTPLKYSTVGGFIGHIMSGGANNSNNILIDNAKCYTNVGVEWNNSDKNGYPLFVGGFAGRILSESNKVRYRNINTYGDVTVSVVKPDMFMNALFMGGSIGNIYLGSVEQSHWYGSRVQLVYGDNIYDNTRFGQYIAAGGFVGIAGINRYNSYGSRFEEDDTTTFWNCSVTPSDSYTINPKITKEMQVDRYIGGEIATGAGDGDYDSTEVIEEYYNAAHLADSTNYAHIISAPTFSNNMVNFTSDWMWLSTGVGGFAGWALADFDDCYVENAYIDATLSGGGFAGVLFSQHIVDYDPTADDDNRVFPHYPIKISDCFARDIYVTSNCLSGGLVGYSEGYNEVYDGGSTQYGVEFSDTNTYNINGLTLKSQRYDNINVYKGVEHIGGFIAQTVGNSISDALALSLIGIDKEVNDTSGLGGLIGMARDSKINNVITLGAISVSDCAYVGGVLGSCYDSSLSDATNLSFIYGDDSPYVGGVLGEVTGSALSGLYNLGPISPRSNTDYYGGVVGYLAEDNELNKNFYSYAPIKMLNNATFAFDMTKESLKLIKDIVGAVRGDPVSLCYTVASIVLEAVEYTTYKGAKGKCGGLFGSIESIDTITNISIPAKGDEYLYLWDQYSTEQDSGVPYITMKACKSKTKELLDYDFPGNSGLNNNADNTFGYYIPWDCAILYKTMKQGVKSNYK